MHGLGSYRRRKLEDGKAFRAVQVDRLHADRRAHARVVSVGSNHEVRLLGEGLDWLPLAVVGRGTETHQLPANDSHSDALCRLRDRGRLIRRPELEPSLS